MAEEEEPRKNPGNGLPVRGVANHGVGKARGVGVIAQMALNTGTLASLGDWKPAEKGFNQAMVTEAT